MKCVRFRQTARSLTRQRFTTRSATGQRLTPARHTCWLAQLGSRVTSAETPRFILQTPRELRQRAPTLFLTCLRFAVKAVF